MISLQNVLCYMFLHQQLIFVIYLVSFHILALKMANRLVITEGLLPLKILVIEYFVLARIQTISLFFILLEK